jgi:hypothetical protein
MCNERRSFDTFDSLGPKHSSIRRSFTFYVYTSVIIAITILGLFISLYQRNHSKFNECVT